MKYKVEIREVIYTEIEVKASDLEEVEKVVRQQREYAGNMVKPPETSEFTATIFHRKGQKEINIF